MCEVSAGAYWLCTRVGTRAIGRLTIGSLICGALNGVFIVHTVVHNAIGVHVNGG